ncbi:MAG: 3-keto-disaccharide hydrolase, partial [Planctomycetota bacterium]
GGGCGGLYRKKNPDPFDEFSLASFPPDVWQTYDIEARVNKDQKGKEAVVVTVYHNGIKIHDNVNLGRGPRKRHFHFQDHGNPVRYRNIWVKPVEQEPKGEL